MRRFEYEVLVIGGGGAGAIAAYEAAKDANVGLVSKGRVGRSGCTILAPGAVAGVDEFWAEDEDSKELHMKDTVEGGAFINEQNLLNILIEKAPDIILEMERIGALWERNEEGDNYQLRTGGGHTHPRCVHMEDRTGREIMMALSSILRKMHIKRHEGIMITKIVKGANGVKGAIGFDTLTLEPVLFEAPSVILATGGAGMVYSNTSNPLDVTGDGYKLALDAGAALMDMEFVQFFPIGFLSPKSYKGVLAGVPYHLHLRNSEGERFMKNYDPERMELSTRDKVARAMFSEVKEGRGGPLGGVYCDMRYQTKEFLQEQQPFLYKTYRKLGIDPQEEMFEVMPTCHFFMGGVVVDESWETDVPGLYAAGEVVGGIHGANRLSQNALAHILVSGKIAGKEARERSNRSKIERIGTEEVENESMKLENIKNEHGDPGKVRDEIRNSMWENSSVFRTEESLQEELKILEDLEAESGVEESGSSNEIITYLENQSLIEVSRCISMAALEREESRGAHYRYDFEEKNDDEWLKHLVIRKEGEELVVENKDVEMSYIGV
ncbi:MAG: FAD-binding protein [Candidatus Saliniplasma sp.]